MKLRVLEGENFSCHSCSQCCRSWLVVLTPGEPQRIANLRWPAGDPLAGKNVLLEHGGKTYVAHEKQSGCVFLNPTNGLCRIHEQFGAEAKPLGCRVFPFQISQTFAGEVSITGRYDCPSVRQNLGDAHSSQLGDLNRYVKQMNLDGGGFDDSTCCYLDRDQIKSVVEFVATLLSGFERDDQRALFIAYLCDALETMQVDELDRVALARLFPVLKRQVLDATDGSAKMRHPGRIHRLAFRTLLGMYLRRDEDVLIGRAGRLGRTTGMTALVLGLGNFRRLGLSHRTGSLRRAKLFKHRLPVADANTFALHWRMIRNKLESFQFMGQANGGRNFLLGLQSLALLYPLVLAVAKYSALNRGASQIEPDDVDYAVAVIEHSYGRSGVLNQPWIGSLQKLLMQREPFTRLVRSI